MDVINEAIYQAKLDVAKAQRNWMLLRDWAMCAGLVATFVFLVFVV